MNHASGMFLAFQPTARAVSNAERLKNMFIYEYFVIMRSLHNVKEIVLLFMDYVTHIYLLERVFGVKSDVLRKIAMC